MKILITIGHYLPGYKAGGPTRTLANVVELLGDEFQFYVLSADRDLGDSGPYSNIEYGKWCEVGKAKVRYVPPGQMAIGSWCKLLRTIDYDLLYLSSLFGRTTRRTLFLRRCGLLPDKPALLAPRGELSKGAMEIKAFKKRVYWGLTVFIGLYDGILWQASSHYEMSDILAATENRFTRAAKRIAASSVTIAPNLSILPSQLPASEPRAVKRPHSARIVFLSRVARMKNLDYALELLREVHGDIEFDIYGPIEDADYWHQCQALMSQLPRNIRSSYKGPLDPDNAIRVFGQYHLFLFPTHGENFGQVIIEALSRGCVVLTSDQTPWRDLAERKAGSAIPLDKPDRFRDFLDEFMVMDDDTFSTWSEAARDYALGFINDARSAEANRRMFIAAASHEPQFLAN